MAIARRVLFINVLLLTVNICISFTAHSQNESLKQLQLLGNNLGQQLLAIDAMDDKSHALDLITTLSNDQTLPTLDKISVFVSKSRILHQLGQLDKAIETAQLELKLAHKFQLQQLEADAYKRIGVYAYYNGNQTLALASYQKSLDYYLTIDEPISQANLYNNIALVQTAMSELEAALLSYEMAQPLYQIYGTEVDKVDVKYNIGTFHLELKRFDIAISIFHDVADKRSKMGDMHGLAAAYSDLGTAYKFQKDYEKADIYLKKALNLQLKYNNDYLKANTLHNLAELSNINGDSEQAIAYAQEAIRLSIEQQHNTAYVGALNSLGEAYFYQGKFELALDSVKEANDIAIKMQYTKSISSNLSLMSLIYASQQQTYKAIKNQREFLQAQYDLQNTQLNTKLALFNSEQLKREVEQLKQQKRLQELETEQADQQRTFIILGTLATLLIAFLLSRRLIEKRSKQALETKVKQRTNELEYLMQELKNANNIKSQFLANMSHEIRTPLTTVIGQAEAILSGDVEEEFITKEVKIIHGNSLHLLELTNNILDLSKIEANKIELEIQTQDLHDILQEIANMFNLQAKSKGLTFDIIHSLPKPFLIDMDGFRVKQILINLCANAIKFTPRGHVELNISQQLNNLVFKITDSGIGMSSSQLQNLFECFTQGDSSISRRFGGTGLGLCLSDQLAKIMGGKIDVESELNQGSVFAFILPYKANEIAACVESKVLANTESIAPKQEILQGKVLLAEDHNDNRRLIARLLASLGLEVLTARNGREAIALFENHQPTLILMDIQMPEMDGIEAFKALRQKGCKAPIIALTANAMSHEITQYLSLGFNGHLSKPIERDIFIPTIVKYYDDNISLEKAKKSFQDVDMSDLVEEFKSNLVLEQQDLILHINNSEFEKLAYLAHRIAGAGQMFGFAALSHCALELEKVIKSNGQSTEINEHTQSLLNEIDQVLW